MSRIVHRRNLDFLLYELLELEGLLADARFMAYDRTAISGALDVTQRIAENEFLPCAAELDADEPHVVDGRVAMIPQTRKALDACARAGLFATSFDERIGGLQLPTVVSIFMNGMLACANIGIANYQFLTVANANMLNTFGTAEQKARFLAPMLEGRWFGTMCLSEPQAGSSLSDIPLFTTARSPLFDIFSAMFCRTRLCSLPLSRDSTTPAFEWTRAPFWGIDGAFLTLFRAKSTCSRLAASANRRR